MQNGKTNFSNSKLVYAECISSNGSSTVIVDTSDEQLKAAIRMQARELMEQISSRNDQNKDSHRGNTSEDQGRSK